MPLLVLWLGYREHVATGTSLAAIGLIAVFAAATHGAYGVDVAKGPGRPARRAGVLVGTSLQQRISGRTISLVFSALLVAVAIELLV